MTYFHAWVLDFFDVGNLGDVRVNAVPIYFCEAGVAVVGGGTASWKRATATSEKNKSQMDQASAETFIKLNTSVKKPSVVSRFSVSKFSDLGDLVN